MSELAFLPHLRRGLARHLATRDPTTGGLEAASLTLGLTVAGTPVSREAGLLAPHRVAALGAGEIVRRYPAPGAGDAETTTFPLVEFRAPDLPWRFTPAGPGTHGRLRPWLALVVVERDADGIAYAAAGASAQLTVAADQRHQLPPADELWAWAHVQSSAPATEIETTVDATPGAVRSRIVCPRRLAPATAYRAALVGAFRAGAQERSEPAWDDAATGAVELVVYDTWTFATSAQAGDFEALAERLEPATEVATLGVRDVDVSDCGLDVAWPRRPLVVGLVGALADPAAITGRPPRATDAFAAAAVPILDEVLDRAPDAPAPARDYDPLQDDPVVGPPFYGAWPAAATSVPAGGWARELNLWTDRRMAAGLGAAIVRNAQETLMAAAWDQLGRVREAADELNRGRLAAEAARSFTPRLAALAAGDRIAVAAPLLTYLSVDGTPARRAVAASAAPTAMLDRVWLRRAPRAAGAAAADAFVRATRAGAGPAQTAALAFQAVAAPQGMAATDEELATSDDPVLVLGERGVSYVEATGLDVLVGGHALSEVVRRGRAPARSPSARRRRARAVVLPSGGAGATADDVAAAVTALDPLAATRAALVARIPALGALLAEGELPAALALAPSFTDALFWDLAELDEDVIVPGLGDVPVNRVRLLAVNGAFVGALLAGANHALACELVWREFPADLGATFFQRFFDHTDPAGVDIAPIAGWPAPSAVADNVTTAQTSTAILIRGDLVQRYPDVSVSLAPPGRGGAPDVAAAVAPSFSGLLGADALVVGFAVPTDEVLGVKGPGEHYVVLEERVVAPRFGLDLTRRGPLTTWSELSWTDVADPDHVRVDSLPVRTIDGVTWGRNAAHMAAATYQQPYRRLYPATRLVGAS
jgi:hypothetical protein